jgi:hypothetical protein
MPLGHPGYEERFRIYRLSFSPFLLTYWLHNAILSLVPRMLSPFPVPRPRCPMAPPRTKPPDAVSIRLNVSPADRDRIRDAANRAQLPMSTFVRGVVLAFLNLPTPAKPRKKTR